MDRMDCSLLTMSSWWVYKLVPSSTIKQVCDGFACVNVYAVYGRVQVHEDEADAI